MPTVLITGANRGLGLEFVRQYAANGWETLATARDPEQARELLELAAKHPNVSLYELNLGDDKSIRELAVNLHGRPIDVLLHNSGIYPRDGQKIGGIDFEAWLEAVKINLFGAMKLTGELLENVAASKRKQIVAISTSMASIKGVQRTSGALGATAYQYRTSKAALNMAFSVLAKELEPRGISVTMIDPGWVKTDMGGPHAQLTPEQSITGMRKVLAEDPRELSGKFLGHDGIERAW